VRTPGAREHDPKAAYAAAEKDVKAAIEAGKITPEQGRAKLRSLRERLAQGVQSPKEPVKRARAVRTPGAGDRDPKAVYAAAVKEIKAAVKAGKITEAQGEERLAGLRRRLAAPARQVGERGEAGTPPEKIRAR
jgi:uncharacterized protein YlaN (UPF0358 family)